MKTPKLTCMAIAVLALALLTPASCDSKDDSVGPVGHRSPRGFLYDGPSLAFEYDALMAIEKPWHAYSDYRDVAIIKADGPAVYPNGIGPMDPYIFPETDSLPYPRKGLFEKLREMNGDSGFVKGTPYYDEFYHHMLLQHSLIEDITEVQVTAMSDYDADHPKGASLAEITNVNYSTLLPFIQAGYDVTPSSRGNGPHPLLLEMTRAEVESTNALDITAKDGFWRHCKAADIRANPIKMSCGMLALTFDSKPAQEATIEVAVTVQMRGGEYPARTYRQTYKVR